MHEAVIHALIYRAKMLVLLLAKEMDYLHRALLENNYPDWMIKESEKKPATPLINPDTGFEVNKNVFISSPYVADHSDEFRRIFQYTSVHIFCPYVC